MLKINNNVFLTVIQTLLLLVITSASLVYLYDQRQRISGKLVSYLNEGKVMSIGQMKFSRVVIYYILGMLKEINGLMYKCMTH